MCLWKPPPHLTRDLQVFVAPHGCQHLIVFRFAQWTNYNILVVSLIVQHWLCVVPLYNILFVFFCYIMSGLTCWIHVSVTVDLPGNVNLTASILKQTYASAKYQMFVAKTGVWPQRRGRIGSSYSGFELSIYLMLLWCIHWRLLSAHLNIRIKWLALLNSIWQ